MCQAIIDFDFAEAFFMPYGVLQLEDICRRSIDRRNRVNLLSMVP